MYIFTPCAAGCGMPAIHGSALCASHQVARLDEERRIKEFIINTKTINDLNAQGLHFRKMDFSGCQIFESSFSGAVFDNCIFNNTRMRLVFFDFTTFNSCEFINVDFHFLSFGGAAIEHCRFDNSELVDINFGGANIIDTEFCNNNLYNSRFIESKISKTSIVNCNVKRVNFCKSRQDELVFKTSNTAEAIFDMGTL